MLQYRTETQPVRQCLSRETHRRIRTSRDHLSSLRADFILIATQRSRSNGFIKCTNNLISTARGFESREINLALYTWKQVMFETAVTKTKERSETKLHVDT